MQDRVLCWLHVGDLHLTEADADNHRDLLGLIDLANRHLAGHVDFAVLPGDVAEHGSAAQFRLARAAIDRLRMPVHILPGDHDFHSGRLDDFHAVLGAAPLPHAVRAAGRRCLFLDIVSAGGGGPDFRLDDAQFGWLEAQLADAHTARKDCAVFMHAYPADLREGGARLAALLDRHRVACVDMGHTHYNELANDGRTVFMATRSTGQTEEGPPGASLGAVDGGVVSWRFAPLAGTWPLVLVTSPADHRLITRPDSPDHVLRNEARVRAKVWSGAGIRRAGARLAGGPAHPLAPDARDTSLWQARVPLDDLPDGLHALTVHAEDADGGLGEETITVLVRRDGAYDPPARHRDGSDRDAIGAWPEKHLLGTRLGPNRNGRQW